MFASSSFQGDASAEVANGVFALARALFAPDAVVHLGAGTGQGPLHQWRQWQVPLSLVVDAQENRMAWAKDWVAQGPGHYSKAAAVGVDGAKASFKIASNPNESGLIDPEALKALWSNLKRIESFDTASVGLDGLLTQTDGGALLKSSKLWLLVDFFCPEAFWAGANDTLHKVCVVVVRQSKTALTGVESPAACDKRMAALGFMRAADLESNHPQVTHGVYLRNLTADLQQSLAQCDQEAKAKTELAGKLEEESKARTALEEEALTKNALRAQEKAMLSAARDLEAKAKEVLSAEKDELLKTIGQLNGSLQSARVELDNRDVALAKLNAEAKQRVDAEHKTKTEIHAKLQVELKMKSDLSNRNQTLETENQELQNRQKLMNEELRKAATQIELIKDLLMRDSLA